MLFSSWQFIVLFLPITFAVYFYLNHRRMIVAGKTWLVAASLYFYAYWDSRYLALILASMLLNFAIGTGLAQAQRHGTTHHAFNRKVVLATGIAANLILLGYYKYTDFLLSNINAVAGTDLALPHIILPLAISFFTFTQIAYLVDSYRGETAEYDLLNYALFVTFFPHLIAGPVVHHRDIMPQFASKWTQGVRYPKIERGLLIFSIGLFKKVVIADTFAIWANAGFDNPVPLDFFGAWATSLSYTFQLYFDFSGYCDMAIGASLLFNVWLPINFNSPYKALSIQDFWRRWHITLSNFLRDYLYIPLGGNRGAKYRVYANLMITFILGGLWHGATWMFVAWGALHGLALAVHRYWQSFGLKMPRPMAWFLTFFFVNFAWIFFRAKTWDEASRILKGMFDFSSAFHGSISSIPTAGLAWGGRLSDLLLSVLPVALVPHVATYACLGLAFLLIAQRNSLQVSSGQLTTRKMFFGSLLFATAMYFTLAASSTVFLYFNF